MVEKIVSVKLSTKIYMRGGKVRVEYGVVNQGDKEIFVFDKFYRTKITGERELDNTLSYVLFEGGNTIHVTRSAMRIPYGLKVEAPEVPYASLLPPKKESRGLVEVPVPVRERRPYEEPGPKVGGKKVVFSHVYFSIGVLPKLSDAKFEELVHVGKGIYAISYAYAVTHQTLKKSPLVALQVEGLVF